MQEGSPTFHKTSNACNETVEFTAPDSSVASFANVHGILTDFSAVKHFHAGAPTDRASAAAVVIFAGMRVALWVDVEVLYTFSTMCFRHFSSVFLSVARDSASRYELSQVGAARDSIPGLRSCLNFFGGLHHRLQNLGIAGATTDVPTQGVTEFFLRPIRIFIKQRL